MVQGHSNVERCWISELLAASQEVEVKVQALSW